MRRMFLNGTAMSGQKDHGAVSGTTFIGVRRTAALYRFVAVRDEYPGLLPVTTGGLSIVGELYEMTESQLVDGLLPEEPPELARGEVTLDDGEVVNAMQLQLDRIPAGDKAVDIADLGGWRAYQAHLAACVALDVLLGRNAG